MGILDALLGTSPSLFSSLFGTSAGGTTPPIGIAPGQQPSIPQMPGGVPSMPGNAVPWGQGGLLGNGILGNAARGALYGLGAAGQPGSRGFAAGIGRGAQQSIGMQQQRSNYGLGQALGQQEYEQKNIQNQMLNTRLGLFNQALARRLSGQGLPGDQAGPDAQGAQGEGAAQGAGGGQGGNLDEYRYWQARAEQTYQDASLGIPGASNELAKNYADRAAQSLGYKTAAAMADAMGKPLELQRPGAQAGMLSPDGQGGLSYRPIAQNPIQVPGVDAQGNPTSRFVFPPINTGQQQGAGAAPPHQAARPMGDNIYDMADADYGLPAGSMRTIHQLENAQGDPNAVSPNGKGVGLVQINPDTVPSGTDLKKRLRNVDIGAARLAEYQQRYQKYGPQYAPMLGAMAYLKGPKNVDNWLFNGAKPDDPNMQDAIRYGQAYAAGIQGPGGNGTAQPAPQQQAQPSATGGGFQTGLGPAQVEEAKGEGERNNQARSDAQTAAKVAQNHMQLLDQMSLAADDFRLGRGAGITAVAQSWGQYLGMNSDEANRQLGAYQDMSKLAITAGSAAIKDVSAREALQGQERIWKAQPNPEMSPEGFRRVVESLRGADQAVLAKNQWMSQQPRGTAVEAEWAKNTNAQAANVYWLQHMAETNPDLAREIVNNLQQDAAGQKLLKQITDSKNWLRGQGLI